MILETVVLAAFVLEIPDSSNLFSVIGNLHGEMYKTKQKSNPVAAVEVVFFF